MQSCPLELATPGGPGDEQKREAEGEAEEHDAKAARNEEVILTDVTRSGYIAMASQEEELSRQVDELIALGTAFLDQLKLDFVKRMEETRANIKQFCLGQAAGWGEQSGLILDLQRRAQMANLLVTKLGIKVSADERPSELLSESQEPASALG